MSKPVCALCYADIGRPVDGVSSDAPCKHSFHVLCVKVKLLLDSSRAVAGAVRGSCPVCQTSTEHLAVLKSINDRLARMDDTADKVDSLVSDVTRLNRKVDALAADGAAFKKEVAEIRGSVRAVRRDLDEVVRDVSDNAGRLKAVEDAVASGLSGGSSGGLSQVNEALFLQVVSRDMASQLVISGVPESSGDGEDLSGLVIALGHVLDVALDASNIVRVERMGKRRTPGASSGVRAILLVLRPESKCVELIAGKRKVPDLRACSLIATYPDTKVYVNHRQPAPLHQLRTRILRQFPLLKPSLIWISDGVVLVRKDASSKPVRVLPSDDLSQLSM